LYYLL